MKKINLNSWPRRPQYELFRHMVQPHLSITAEVDATHLVENLKPKGVSTFNAALYCILHSANVVPEFKTRFRDNDVIEHNQVGVSITVPLAGGQFAFCEIEYNADWDKFNQSCKSTIAQAKQQTKLVENIKPGNDAWIFTSCIPWIKFTAMKNPLTGPDDCVPRIVWGKISQDKDGTWSMPVVVEVHHALVDGVHMGQFFTKLQETLYSI